MKAFAAVFAREVRERRMVFLVGLCCGLPMLVASALHGWSAPGNPEVRLLAAAVGGLSLAVALAILYGASTIAGETADKRISFYFSRPIPAGAIWAGKLLAALVLSFSAGLLVFLPGWLTGPERASTWWGFEATPGRVGLAAFALVLTFLLASHAIATVGRLRSPWAALDLVLAIALTGLTAAFVRSLARDGVVENAPAAGAVLAAFVLLAAAAATFAQVEAGRTDARRAHGAFSSVLWGVLGAGVLALGGFTGWCAAAKATDLAFVERTASAAPRGSWTFVGGPLRGGRGAGRFLVDPASGRSIRIRGFDVTFSQDGTRGAWGEPDFGLVDWKSNRVELMVADLASGRVSATGIVTAGWGWIVLSPSGRRVADWDGTTLSAWDVSDPDRPRLLAAFPLKGARRLAFVGEDTIRTFPRVFSPVRAEFTPEQLEITELSLSSKKSLVTGHVDNENLPWLRLSPDERYFVGVRRSPDDAQNGPATVSILDGRTGSPVATLVDGLRNAQARFLSDNRLVVVGLAGAKARAHFFEGEKNWAAPARTVELGPAARLALGGEIAPGRVAVSLITFEENRPGSRRAAKVALVDAGSGAVSLVDDPLVPVNRFGWWFDPVMSPAGPGAPWTSLFLDADGRLVRLDPATGARTVLLGRSK